MKNDNNSNDNKTAKAFSKSWNNLPGGSIYTKDQFVDWMHPLTSENFKNKKILELGCGNASLMVHATCWEPEKITGVDLGDSVIAAKKNMEDLNFKRWEILKSDLTDFKSSEFDLVYCIGVLHHLKYPERGLDSVIRNTKSKGRFHCWVYAKEGNSLIIYFVDPIRKIVSRLPWWFTKYFIALPLVFPYFIYAKIIKKYKKFSLFKKFPLYEYSTWIAERNFNFFHHVAFDQLVTPQTTYLDKQTIERWLKSYNQIDQKSIYIISRNGNSWKFGGIKL